MLPHAVPPPVRSKDASLGGFTTRLLAHRDLAWTEPTCHGSLGWGHEAATHGLESPVCTNNTPPHHHITTSPHHHIINTRKAARAQKAAGITHPTTTTQRHTRSTWYTIQTTTTGPCLCLLTTAHRDAFQLEGAVVCTIQLQAVVPHGKLVVLDRLGARLKGLL